MTNDRLRLLADELWDYSRKLGEKKGAEYAHMDSQDDDRFRNFKLAAQVAMMENPGQSVMNYLMKSFMSIGRYVASNCDASMNEPVRDRFADLLNYTIMLYGWVIEQEEANEQRAYHGDGEEIADPFSTVEYSGNGRWVTEEEVERRTNDPLEAARRDAALAQALNMHIEENL